MRTINEIINEINVKRREEKLTTNDVSKATGIKVEMIDAIESNKKSQNYGEFLVCFIKYTSYLKIDTQEALNSLGVSNSKTKVDDLGHILKYYRLKRKKTLGDVAADIKIGESILNKIEIGELEEIQKFYRKNYLTRYTEYLNVEPIVLKYINIDEVLLFGSIEEDKPTKDFQEFDVKDNSNKNLKLVILIMFIVIIILLGLTVKNMSSVSNTSVEDAITLEEEQVEEEQVEEEPEEEEQVEEEQVEEEQVEEEQVEELAYELVEGYGEYDFKITNKEEAHVVVSFSADCYIELYVDGELEDLATYSDGDKLEFDMNAGSTYELLLGYTGGATITADDVELKIPEDHTNISTVTFTIEEGEDNA